MAAADPGPISSTRSGMAGGKALSSATGLVGRVLAEKAKGLDLGAVRPLTSPTGSSPRRPTR